MKQPENDSNLIAFTGGGTGGHIYPGLAVVQALRSRGFSGKILWIGSTKELDRQIVEAEGLEYRGISSGKLRRSFSLENLADVLRVISGYREARKILSDLRPAFLFSKGGYVSVPPCRAAASLGIPYVTHESDVSPGLATRLNAGKAEKILLSWSEGAKDFSEAWKAKTEIVGNPVRPSLLTGDAAKARARLGIPGEMPVILCLGGSQGSLQVNRLVEALRPAFAGKAFIVHQTGRELFDSIPEPRSEASYLALPYIGDEMRDILAAATVVTGRAGAGTVWESAALGKPMVLIPLAGNGTRGDQVENAAMVEKAGAGISLAGDKAQPEALIEALGHYLFDPEARGKAQAAALSLARIRRPDGSWASSAEFIAQLILERMKASQGGGR
jgi:UDP-N-acetylglucosamine--N-acetylmuramyl-(pentapeptide) pyrophosphoryl-undecaprenol N-acetylglucosamine transferase